MLTLDLSLKIAVPAGQGKYNFLPPIERETLRVDFIDSKGGEKRGFKDEQPIMDEMELGDELRQAIQQQNLRVGRFSDSFSLDLLQLFNSKQKVSAFMIAWICSENNISKRATLVMHNAQVTLFERRTSNGKNYECVRFAFDSNNAKIEYGNNIEVVTAREIGKAFGNLGTAVGSIFR